MGLNPNDPNGQDDIVIVGDDLHLPVGKPVKVLLRSIDVLHDFYVPEFRAKMDMMPGLVTYFWFTPTRTGTFEVLCAGLCGVGHPDMRGKVVVDSESDYQAWLRAAADVRAAARTAQAQATSEAGPETTGRGATRTDRQDENGFAGPHQERTRRRILMAESPLAQSALSRPPKSRTSNSTIPRAG